MSVETLSAVAGIVLSLLFSYVPGLDVWFAALESKWKQAIMGVCILLVGSAAFALSCTTWGAAWGIELTCDQPGAQVIISTVIAALVANQAVYKISPETGRVTAIKAARG